jgi:hypothetical protein
MIGKTEGGYHKENRDINWKTLLKLILGKSSFGYRIGFVWLGIGTLGGLCKHDKEPFFTKFLIYLRVVLVSQVLYSMELAANCKDIILDMRKSLRIKIKKHNALCEILEKTGMTNNKRMSSME